MRSNAATPKAFLDDHPDDWKEAMRKLRKIINSRILKGFEEVMAYGMLAWVVPHKLYPAGYHCDQEQGPQFINAASQKNYITLFHMGLYEGGVLDWFKKEWGKVSTKKLDVGKCCIRFKTPKEIPFDLIGELASRITPKAADRSLRGHHKPQQ